MVGFYWGIQKMIVLSLYSTAMQNYWRWGFALGQLPNAKIRVGDTNMLVSKNAFTPTRTLKFALPPTQNPNASQWNIGCVGSPTQNSCIGHVDFMLFIPFFSRWVPNGNAVLSGIWALEQSLHDHGQRHQNAYFIISTERNNFCSL